MNTFESFMNERRKLARSKDLRKAMALQDIEQNPLTDSEIAMFERFEAQGLDPEARRAEIAASIERDFDLSA